MNGRAVFSMAVGQRPGASGHADLAISWLVGLRAAGFDVVFVDRLDPTLGDVGRGIAWVSQVMDQAGFDDRWSVLLDDSGSAGMSRRDVAAHARDAVHIDVMGYIADHLDGPARRAYLDIDPGFGQTWSHLGLVDAPKGYDAYFTVGLAAGGDWDVPDDSLTWRPLPPPVDTDRWTFANGPAGPVSTIATWRGPYDPIYLDGRRLGLRAHAMRPLADLPDRAAMRCVMALDIDDTDAADARRLRDGGWELVPPDSVADINSYQHFIASSSFELCVAKELYSELRTGWVSDRSVRYLASGRPVVMSDTGLPIWLRTGYGLKTFTDSDSALSSMEDIIVRYEQHRDAARQLALDVFEASRVAGEACRVLEGVRSC
jgi:hypothetical protein